MAKFSKEWEQEFEMLKEMQESRMHLASAKQCLDRCTKHLDLLTNIMLPHEQTCLEHCLAKRAQASFIVAANVAKYEEMEARKGQKQGWM